MPIRKQRSRKQRGKQRGGRIPDSWEISVFLQDGAREAGMFEGEDDDEDYDYNYPTSEWFEAHYDEVIANMMTEFSASESDILEGLRLWYNNGEEGMGYYFGWIEDKLNENNSESSNAESVQTGDPTNNGETNNNNPRGGKRQKSRSRKTRKIKKTRK